MRRLPRNLTAVLAAVLLAACGSAGSGGVALSSDVEYQRKPTFGAQHSEVGDRCIDMGLQVLADGADETVVFSPMSWCMALGMLAGGTSGQGREELEAALGASVGDVHAAFNALAVRYDAFDVDPGTLSAELPEQPVVHQASNVVIRKGFDVSTQYLDGVKRYFDAGIQQAELSAPEGKEVLDAWVRTHTGGRIEQSAIEPSADLIMVLQDALFFASRWSTPLSQSSTGPFTTSGGTTTDVEYVGEVASFEYAQRQGWAAVRLPFDGDLAATLLLPPPDGAALTPSLRRELLDALDQEVVAVSVPAFSVAGTVDLLPWLSRFGMRSLADSDAAPLEGIAPGHGLHVGQAVQQAKVELDGAGVVAVGVTEIGIREVSAPAAPPRQVRFDRPFVMLITDDVTGMDLFQVAVASIEG